MRKKKAAQSGIWAIPMAMSVLVVLLIVCLAKRDSREDQTLPEETVVYSTPNVTTARNIPDETRDETSAEEIVSVYAEEHGIDFNAWPQSIIDLLDRNPETEDFVLAYPELHDKQPEVDMSEYIDCSGVPLFLQWDQRWGYLDYGSDVAGITGCGPTCLSMVAYYLTRDPAMSPDNMIRFALENGYYVPGIGSAWTLISQGGVELGLDVTEIPLDQNRIIRNLQVGNPIICVMGPGDFTDTGHFIVMVGYENGKIRINDPNSREKSGKLWDYQQIEDQIKNLWVIRNGIGTK